MIDRPRIYHPNESRDDNQDGFAFQEKFNLYAFAGCVAADYEKRNFPIGFPGITYSRRELAAFSGKKNRKTPYICLDVCRAEPIKRCSWIKYTYVADSKKPSERQQCEGKRAHVLRMLTTHVHERPSLSLKYVLYTSAQAAST